MMSIMMSFYTLLCYNLTSIEFSNIHIPVEKKIILPIKQDNVISEKRKISRKEQFQKYWLPEIIRSLNSIMISCVLELGLLVYVFAGLALFTSIIKKSMAKHINHFP